MSGRRVRIEEVLVYLGIEESGFLEELRGEGLFVGEELEPEQAEDLRVAQLLFEDLGVNVAGIDVALHLRRRLMALERRAQVLARALHESGGGSGSGGR